MDDRSAAGSAAPGELIVAGLGPGALDRIPAMHRALLADIERAVVVRTLHHPAARELAALRPVESCDDLYETAESFEDVYDAIADRVMAAAEKGPVVYAVPGSPLVGEFAVRKLMERGAVSEMIPAESFVDAILAAVGYDPFSRGLRIINGHELPDTLAFDSPTIIGHLDAPAVLADVAAAVSRALPEGSEVIVCVDVGGPDERLVKVEIDRVPADLAGFRTSLFVDCDPAGLVGAVAVIRQLREQCPWDRQQTHHSLVAYLTEEVAELIEALAALPEGDAPDFVAYDAVEEELGDVLFQVLFHAEIATEGGVFGIDDVATRLREKLVRRHPHVFGDVEVSGADEVSANWEAIKRQEKGSDGAESLMDGVPDGMPALERASKLQRRAARVGFDWDRPEDVIEVLLGEVDELGKAMAGEGSVLDELGDVLFSAVNLARQIGVDPEVALRRSSARFEQRFRAMENDGPLDGLGLARLEERWAAAKKRQQ